jgi:hypothetical protein
MSELAEIFDKLKKFKPEHTSVSVGNIASTSGDVEVEIINEDPNAPEDDPDGLIIESFGYDADVDVIDAGIGAYEFWGAKGNDSHMQNEVQSIKLTDEWPEELKWLVEIIEEKICDGIAEMEPSDDRDGDDYYDEPDDFPDWRD